MPDFIEATDASANTSTTYSLLNHQIVQGTLTSNDHDWYRITLTAGTTYTFALEGTGASNIQDTYLKIYASNGTTLLAFNDDSLTNSNSRITYTATTTGTYYVDAAAWSGTDTGQYSLIFTDGTRPSYDIAMGGGAIDTDSSWSASASTPVTVTYGFRQTAAAYSASGSNIASFTQVSATERTAVRTAFHMWSDVCGITFQEVNQGGYTDSATMLIGNYTDAIDGAGAFAYYPGSTASAASPGDVWLNTDSISTSSAINFGSYSLFAIMHELGHAIGLSHPGLYNASPGASITYGTDAQFMQDSNQYTIMSYFDETNTGANFGAYASSPMLYDIYEAQLLYGENYSTRATDSVYGFNSNVGAPYSFTAGSSSAFCIWDGGGTDTIDASGYSQSQIIDLRSTAFSNFGGLTGNVSIAYGATIENAIGGSGSDTITGNSSNNQLTGNAGSDIFFGGGGNDMIDGGAGIDTAAFSTARSAYFAITNNGAAVIFGYTPDGVDSLSNVESLRFSDQTITTSSLPVFKAYEYLASYGDLIQTFGSNTQAAWDHFVYAGSREGRSLDLFGNYRYTASFDDLVNAFGNNSNAAAQHFVQYGYAEGRNSRQFNFSEYAASYTDLLSILGNNSEALAQHYIEWGRNEGRQRDAFDNLRYTASYNDLVQAFGANSLAATDHFVTHGFAEGRSKLLFDAVQYIATYPDLINTFGTNTAAATEHFVLHGFTEGRSRDSFNAAQYLANYADLRAVYGIDQNASTLHYIQWGSHEGRTDHII